jgi:hypothetical protein
MREGTDSDENRIKNFQSMKKPYFVVKKATQGLVFVAHYKLSPADCRSLPISKLDSKDKVFKKFEAVFGQKIVIAR